MEGRYSLLRIIMIDCHIQGRVTELKVDDHTNISGTNAAGKTTLQRLLPLFWGERPSNIQRRSKVKDTVPRFYLPRESSLLVYEYIRVNGQICQVIICSDPTHEKLQYRFVGKAYNEDDYGIRKLDGKYKPGSVRDIGGNLRLRGVECSELISSVQEYRAVIQNNRQYLRMNRKLRTNLSSLAYQFSMCDANESLVHMEKIVSAILTKNGKLDAMRQMVAQIIQENSQAFEAPKIDGDALRAMTNDIAMLLAFKSNQKNFDELIGIGLEFDDVILSVSTHKSQLLYFKPKLEEIIESLESELEILNKKKKQLSNDWEKSRGGLIKDRQEKESKKDIVENRITNIQDKRKWWIKQDIRTLKADVEALPQKRDIKHSSEERRASLLEEVAADELRLESQKRKVLEIFDRQQTKKHNQINQLKDKRLSEENTYNDNKVRFSVEHNAAINVTKDQHREIFSNYDRQISSLKIKIGTTNKTQEEESRLLTVERSYKESEKKAVKLNGELLALVKEKGSLNSERNNEERVFTELSRDINELEDRIHELSIAAHPVAGSLQEFLEESVPDWKINIGRVIEPELLRCTDLDPTLTEGSASNEICGVSLCIKKIEPPKFLAEKAALMKMINDEESLLYSSTAKSEKVKGSLKKINLNLENIERNINVIESHISSAKADAESHKDLWYMAKIEVQDAVDTRKQEAIRQCKAIENQRASLEGKHNEELNNIVDIYREQGIDELERWQGIQEAINDDIHAAESSLDSLISHKSIRIEELENDFKVALNEKGIDDKVIDGLTQTIKDLDDEIKNLESRKSLIPDFEEWQRSIWEIELPLKNKEVAELSKGIAHLHGRIKDEDARFEVQQEAINASKVVVEGGYRDYINEKDRMTRIQKEWGAFDEVSVPEAPFSLNCLKQSMNELRAKLNRFGALFRQISEKIDSVANIISLKGNEAIRGGWHQLCEEAQQSCAGLPDGHAYKRHAYIIERLPHLVHDQIVNIEALQKSQAQRYGDQFKKLFDTLISYHRMIDIESRKLGVVISENLDLDGITNAEIGLKSRIKELGYWGTLEKLVNSFDEWKDSGFINLPGEDFLSSLSEMKDLMHKITGSIQLDTIFDLFIKIEENGKLMIITSDALLDDLSSNGMKYLILCKLYMGFTRMLNESRRSVIHWPVDELGELHGNNITKLFQMLNKNNVVMVGALPQPDKHLLGMFVNKYIIDKDTKQLKTVMDDESDLISKLKLLKGKNVDVEEVVDVTM